VPLKVTQFRWLAVPELCSFQVVPPSMESRIRPPFPTATYLPAPAATPFRFIVPLWRMTQSMPLSDVMITPKSPTAA